MDLVSSIHRVSQARSRAWTAALRSGSLGDLGGDPYGGVVPVGLLEADLFPQGVDGRCDLLKLSQASRCIDSRE